MRLMHLGSNTCSSEALQSLTQSLFARSRVCGFPAHWGAVREASWEQGWGQKRSQTRDPWGPLVWGGIIPVAPQRAGGTSWHMTMTAVKSVTHVTAEDHVIHRGVVSIQKEL